MEGPRGLTFSYIKALAFSLRFGRKEKDEEDDLESGRNLPTWKTAIDEMFCSTIYGPQITKERKRQCFTWKRLNRKLQVMSRVRPNGERSYDKGPRMRWLSSSAVHFGNPPLVGSKNDTHFIVSLGSTWVDQGATIVASSTSGPQGVL